MCERHKSEENQSAKTGGSPDESGDKASVAFEQAARPGCTGCCGRCQRRELSEQSQPAQQTPQP